MRTLLALSGGAILLLGLASWVEAVQGGKTYDLRGPAPRKGLTLETHTTLRIKDADTTLKVMGQSLNMKMSMTMVSEEEQKVLEVQGREVTKSQARIRKERAIITSDFGGGMEITQPTELEGQTIISELVGKGKWKHRLVDAQPTEKQKKELDNRIGLENDDDLYPAEKVAVGHEWEVPAEALRKLFGNAIVNVSGKVKQKFVKVETVDGEECAVIESQGKIKGKMKNEDGEPTIDVEMEMRGRAWRSLRTGVEIKGDFSGKITLAGTQKVDDAEVKIEMSGPFSGESRTKVFRSE
jgi:hypothetical protein